jgi:hypothetical protein
MPGHVLAKMARLAGIVLIGLAANICDMLRRTGERRKLSGLSSLERRDLGLHEGHRELKKRPWQH